MKMVKNKINPIIMILGAPGSGKGTYSKLLSRDLKINVLSSGDELRKIISGDNLLPEIKKMKETMEKGHLINDDYVFCIIKEKLNSDEYKSGVILDGYPRRISQAIQWENYKTIDLVIKINLDEEILIKKMLGRRVCEKCGKSYNICEINEKGYYMKPLLPKKSINHCDDCSSVLVTRTDDTESVIRERLNVYKELTLPIEKFYEDKNIVLKFELKKGVDDYHILHNSVASKLI
jgi:adenylate kinase